MTEYHAFKFLETESHVTVTDDGHGTKVLKYLDECWRKEVYCDVCIRVQSRVFKTHRFVLAMLSDYFRALLQHDGEDLVTVTMPDVIADEKTFEAILTFAYTSTISFENVDVQRLAISADFLGISSLKSICEKIMLQNISKDNCFQLMSFGYMYTMPDLLKETKSFWCKDFAILSKRKEFMTIPSTLVLQILTDKRLRLFKSNTDLKPLDSESREKLLFKTVLKYISANLEKEISDGLLELLKAVKLPNLDSGYMIKTLSKFKSIRRQTKVDNLLKLANEYSHGYIDSAPLYWKIPRQAVQYTIESSPAFGTGGFALSYNNCTEFTGEDVDPLSVMKQMKLWIRPWDGRKVLGRLTIVYDDGSIVEGGEVDNNDSMDYYEINFEEGEVITAIELHSGWMIDLLKVTTNKGRVFGPYGGDGGGEGDCSAPFEFGYIHSFSGLTGFTQGCMVVVGLTCRWIQFK